MKSSSVFLIIGIIVIAVGLAWIISAGLVGPAAGTVPPTPAPTTPPAVPATTNAVPVTTAPAATAAAVPPTVATAQITTAATLASGNDIRDHFLDVAYSATNRLERLNYDSTKPRVIISALSASNEDIALIEKTARDFNEASPTVKLSENVKETGTGDIFIKYLPEDGLEVIKLADAPESGTYTEALTRTELYQGSVPAAKIVRGTVYINADLKKEERQHVLVRGLMYQMGLTGESTKFPDSVFYAGQNTNTALSSADKRIITMLYSSGFYNGMNMEELRKVIYLP